MATIPEALAIAIEHHHGGRLPIAEQICRQVLLAEPHHIGAMHFLGVILYQRGAHAEAIACYRKALELAPDHAEALNNLGIALKSQGMPNEAIDCYRRALKLRPDYFEALNNLGIALQTQGKLDEAIECYRRALELRPDHEEVCGSLGMALKKCGRLNEALVCFHRLAELRPFDVEALTNLGGMLNEASKPDEALACFRRALQLKPDYAEAHNNLGVALNHLARANEAIDSFRKAIELKPDHAEAHSNLGNALKERGNLDEAIACYRRALELRPDFAEGQNNLGVALKDVGRLNEAAACFRKALNLNPLFAVAHSNLLYLQIFSADEDSRSLYEEHLRWNDCHAAPLANSIQPHSNDRTPDRRLRVGYVSPNFRNHCQAFFMLPLFSEHNHADFEIVCYADDNRPDAVTLQFRSLADVWRSTTALDDEQVAQAIRRDQIDILVDLSMHMGGNRLLVFARKPAPVQVCWLAYPGTTGMGTIDYRITDPYLDPPSLYDNHYTEESIRLPDTFWCYDPLDNQTSVSAPPSIAKKHITFGCLNNFCKVNPQVLKIWAQVLKAVDRSRIVILAAEGAHRRHVLDVLAEEGVVGDRVTFVVQQPRPQYLARYHDIDIGLDTMPYNGHTTSLDSFWMGAPVVTLVGPTVVGRAGLCQLMNLGLPELIAYSPEQYVSIAVELANDLPRLGQLRASLRDRLRMSPLMDAPRFARNLEAAYREIWRRWCK